MAPKQLTTEHKEAMAAGRTEGRAVKLYLDALAEHRPRRGRQRTSESIRRRLDVINTELGTATSLRRLQLIQERRDLESELEKKAGPAADLSELEADFTKVAKPYAERKGITYATWREMGVSSETLARAGITRGS